MKRHLLGQDVQKIYFRIVLLALFAHFSFAIIFGCLSIYPMLFYNIFSIIFYICMIALVKQKHYRPALCFIHLEITVFVTIATLFAGWDTGYCFYLIALCSLVYFCPFRNIYIPYFFSFAEIVLFMVLKLYSCSHLPIQPISSGLAINCIYIYNALFNFAIILYSAFISNLSSLFTEKDLLKKNQNLQQMLNHDELTRLYTRSYLKERFDSSQSMSRPAFLIMADIDNFKLINDTYGHSCGDYVLFTLATIMKTVCPPNTDISRWGGEEFVLIIYQDTESDIKDSIRRLKEAIASYSFHFEGKEFHITVTFGISSTQEDSDFDHLIDLADERMYCGKKSGKNKVISPG